MVKKSSKKKYVKPSKKLIQLKKERKEKQTFINDTEKKIDYYSKQLSRAKINLEKIDVFIDKNS